MYLTTILASSVCGGWLINRTELHGTAEIIYKGQNHQQDTERS